MTATNLTEPAFRVRTWRPKENPVPAVNRTPGEPNTGANNITPPSKTQADTLASRMAKRQFNFGTPPPPVVPRFTIGDTPISTPGNLTAISAAVKSGKSSFVGAMLASTMAQQGSDCLGLESDNPSGLAVIHFDTEQSVEDHDALARRILRRAYVTEPPSWFKSFCLTGFSVRDMNDALRLALAKAKEECGGVHSVFLDGVGDLVSDVNDAEESNALVAELHGLAIEYACPIVGVIHLNPSGEKTRGHLGSQLERKAETNLRLERDGESIVCWSEKHRRAPISKANGPRFEWSDTAGMHISVEGVADAKASGKRAELELLADVIFSERPSMKFAEIVAKLTAKNGLAVSERTAARKLGELSRLGIIKRSVAGLYLRA